MSDSLGNIFIVAAPSGGGKTSLVKELINSLSQIEVSVSHTTRQPRPGEQQGRDYFFINEAAFEEMVQKQGFVEYAQVFNYYYGTSVAQLNARLQAGIDVVLDIDWQGAVQIRRLFPEAVSIFIIPPSLEVLSQRLQDRGQDHQAVISHRMQQAQNEMSHMTEFDYLIVNDNFTKAAMELKSIVIANRLRLVRQQRKMSELLSLLLAPQ